MIWDWLQAGDTCCHHWCLQGFFGGLHNPMQFLRAEPKVVWPPAILVIGDIESCTFIRGGHRTWTVPKVLAHLDAAAEPGSSSSFPDSRFDTQVSSSGHLILIYYLNFPPSPLGTQQPQIPKRVFAVLLHAEDERAADSRSVPWFLLSLRKFRPPDPS